jgi:hypothetical protein
MRAEYIKRFSGLEEFLEYASWSGAPDWSDRGMDRWAGGETVKQAVKSTVTASFADQYMPRAVALLEKIDASFRDREAVAWMPSVQGAYPIVAEALIGMPEAMRTRRPIESDIAPINIYLENGVSAGVDKQAIVNRGVAIAALILRMSEMRPVQLKLYGAWMIRTHHDAYLFYDVPMSSTPVSVAHVISTIAHDSFLRTLNFAASSKIAKESCGKRIEYGEGFGWAYGAPNVHHEARDKGIRAKFELNPQDIIIQCGFLTDQALMDSDPVAWVHKQLEKQRTIED